LNNEPTPVDTTMINSYINAVLISRWLFSFFIKIYEKVFIVIIIE
jgi:hypothetical protein